MTIQISSKIELKTGKDSELPGQPITLEPLALSPALDQSEIVFTTDLGRVFIGHQPVAGNVNYKRSTFPYQNIEILTETSPRLKELYGQYTSNQTEESFFPSFEVSPAGQMLPILILSYNGTVKPTIFYGTTVSVVIDYHAFVSSGGNFIPLKQGTLRIMANGNDNAITDDNISFMENDITFGITGMQNDVVLGNYYQLMANNASGSIVKLYLRRSYLNGISA